MSAHDLFHMDNHRMKMPTEVGYVPSITFVTVGVHRQLWKDVLIQDDLGLPSFQCRYQSL